MGGERMSRVTASASGAVASFRSPGKVPIRGLTVNFSPVQSGTGDPSPSNVRPITGWTGVNVTRCGKNLFDKTTAVRKDNYYLDDNGNETYSSNSGYLTSKTSVKPNTVYTFRSDNIVIQSNMYWRIYFFDKNGTFISRTATQIEDLPYTFTTPSNCTDISFQYNVWSVDYGGRGIGNWQLELGSSCTAYEVYKGTTLPVTFPSEAGTVYGGSVDLVTGVLTVTHAYLKLSTKNWAKQGTTGWYCEPAGMKSGVKNSGCYASSLPMVSSQTSSTFGVIFGYSTTTRLVVTGSQSTYTTSNELKQYFQSNECEVVYPLATPVTYQLTPQQLSALIGYNNIYSDTDSVEVTYDLAESAEMMRVRQRIMDWFCLDMAQPMVKAFSEMPIVYETETKGTGVAKTVLGDNLIIDNVRYNDDYFNSHSGQSSSVSVENGVLNFSNNSNSSFGIGLCFELKPERSYNYDYTYNNSTNTRVLFFDSDQKIISYTSSASKTFTTPAGTKYVVITFRAKSGGATLSEFTLKKT